MDSAQIISNGEKARTGQEVKDKVGKLLEALRKEELILGFEIEVNHSHKYYGYDKQFKCDFVVKTVDSKVVFRILCHFVKLSKKEMTYDQNQFRHGCRFKAVA